MSEYHLVLTVGTNPLPVLVAARRLYGKFNRPPITFVCSADTSGTQAPRIIEALERSLQLPSGMLTVSKLIVDESNPEDIEEYVTAKLVPVCRDKVVHLHYTGGTKAMSVNVFKALHLADRNGKIAQVEESYLGQVDYRIVGNSFEHLDEETDQRRDWKMTVQDLARLHGVSTEFIGQVRTKSVEFSANRERSRRFVRNPPHPPREEWTQIATSIAKTFVAGDGKAGSTFAGPRIGGKQASTDEQEGDDYLRSHHFKFDFWPDLPQPRSAKCAEKRWPTGPLYKTEEWKTLPGRMNTYFNKELWIGPQNLCKPAVLDPTELEILNWTLGAGGWLEIVVFDALRRVLERVDGPSPEIVIGTHFHPDQAGPGALFELDVAAVRGYELLAVSCSASRNRKDVKQKGFEVLHRARQIGGDRARAIIVGLQDAPDATETERDIELDIAGGMRSGSGNIRVWGRSQVKRLVESFEDYFGEADAYG